jgi:hypothetical protein
MGVYMSADDRSGSGSMVITPVWEAIRSFGICLCGSITPSVTNAAGFSVSLIQTWYNYVIGRCFPSVNYEYSQSKAWFGFMKSLFLDGVKAANPISLASIPFNLIYGLMHRVIKGPRRVRSDICSPNGDDQGKEFLSELKNFFSGHGGKGMPPNKLRPPLFQANEIKINGAKKSFNIDKCPGQSSLTLMGRFKGMLSKVYNAKDEKEKPKLTEECLKAGKGAASVLDEVNNAGKECPSEEDDDGGETDAAFLEETDGALRRVKAKRTLLSSRAGTTQKDATLRGLTSFPKMKMNLKMPSMGKKDPEKAKLKLVANFHRSITDGKSIKTKGGYVHRLKESQKEVEAALTKKLATPVAKLLCSFKDEKRTTCLDTLMCDAACKPRQATFANIEKLKDVACTTSEDIKLGFSASMFDEFDPKGSYFNGLSENWKTSDNGLNTKTEEGLQQAFEAAAEYTLKASQLTILLEYENLEAIKEWDLGADGGYVRGGVALATSEDLPCSRKKSLVSEMARRCARLKSAKKTDADAECKTVAEHHAAPCTIDPGLEPAVEENMDKDPKKCFEEVKKTYPDCADESKIKSQCDKCTPPKDAVVMESDNSNSGASGGEKKLDTPAAAVATK